MYVMPKVHRLAIELERVLMDEARLTKISSCQSKKPVIEVSWAAGKKSSANWS
jgi:hypothetical protein